MPTAPLDPPVLPAAASTRGGVVVRLSAADDATAHRVLEDLLGAAFAQKRSERFTDGIATMASVGG